MKSKRGISLIEVVIVMGIASIITIAILKCTISGIREYTKNVEAAIVEDNFDNAMLNLDNICNSSLIKSVEANEEDNTITVNYITDSNNTIYNVKIIKLIEDKLKVITFNHDNGQTTKGQNVIIGKVSEFKVHLKGKLIYYKIKLENGAERIRCI